MSAYDEIYPAPNPMGALPLDPEVLRAELSAAESSDLRFLLGNVLLRAGDYEQAIDCYQRVLQERPQWAEVRTNLGLSYELAGRVEEAVSEFNQALLLNSGLRLAHSYLGRIRLLQRDAQAAHASFERLLALEPQSVEALEGLAAAAELASEPEAAAGWYLRILEIVPQHAKAKGALARHWFAKGRQLFISGNLDGAFATWGEANRLIEPAFQTEEVVARGMRELIKEFTKDDPINKAASALKSAARSREIREDEYYALFCRFYFSLGLFPEFHEAQSSLAAERERWQLSLVEGDPPFPHFRLALIATYQGRLDEALTELRICIDRLPAKKQESLRLRQINDFVQRLRGRPGEPGIVPSTEEEAVWIAHGFASAFQWRAWQKSGFTAQDAARWRDAGFTPESARKWDESKLSPSVAGTWLNEGFEDPRTVRLWFRAGLDAPTARAWAERFPDRIETAIQCRLVGLDDPADAEQWMRVFLFPGDAVTWKNLGFSPVEALSWTAAGFSDPFVARDWKEKGVAPEIAAMTPTEGGET